MVKVGSLVGTIIFLFTIYLVYTGALTGMDILLGILGSLIIGSFTADLLISNPRKLINVGRWAYLLLYTILYLTIIEIKAHWSVVKIILHPKMPMNPSIVRIPYNVITDYAKTTIANSITNTPGTIVVDVDEKRKTFYVHWIKADVVEDEKAKEMVSATFEYYAKRIFD